MAALPALPVLALYASLAGTAVSAVGAVVQGDNARKLQHTQADQARLNAEEGSRQATLQIESQRTKARSVIGQQLAATSESGTGLSGSNLDLLNQSLYNNEADSMNIRYGADRQAAGLNQQANINDNQADAAMTGSYLSAAGTLVGGASRSYNTYTQAGSLMPKMPTDPWAAYGGRY
jgi:hypothetical protein